MIVRLVALETAPNPTVIVRFLRLTLHNYSQLIAY